MLSPLRVQAVTWCLILAVVVMFVAPTIDLPETALRAHRAAQAIFWILTTWLLSVCAGLALQILLETPAGTADLPTLDRVCPLLI